MLVLGVLTACFVLQTSFIGATTEHDNSAALTEELSKQAVNKPVETKCEACYRALEPFMILKNSNVLNGVKQIYRMVLQI